MKEVDSKLATAIKISTIIHSSATNGDMIKAIFPNEDFHIGKEIKDRNIVYKSIYPFCKLDWWNAPYKKEVRQDMTSEEFINLDLMGLAEDFCKWLEGMGEKYGLDKNDIQALIKQVLM